MPADIEKRAALPDARPLSAEDLLVALHTKFCANFEASKAALANAATAERQARLLSTAGKRLERLAGEAPHQRALAGCLDEIFADTICAIYLASCGLNAPARMLLRRSLELGLLVAAYWDSPVDFWNWREHDADVRFKTLCTFLRSDGYKSFLAHAHTVSTTNAAPLFDTLEELYGELSDVVHPKTYNFATIGAGAFDFRVTDFEKTLSYASKVQIAIATILSARFADLNQILDANPNSNSGQE